MTAMVIKTSQRPLSAEEKKRPYRWALLYGLQLLIILLVGYLFPNLISLAPLLMIVDVIYGFLSNKS
jgi:4-hydroxybenzoate polyprenyltransferase